METRQKTEYKMFLLCLADMHGQVDRAIPVAVFDEKQKLIDYYNSQLTEPWVDEASEDNFGNTHVWQKVFKKGSPLEWYNPLDSFEEDSPFGGVVIDWIDYYPEQIKFRIPFNPL